MNDRFANHIATYFSDTTALGCRVERLVFRKPETTNDYIEFLSIGGELIVRGDLYDAIYSVSRPQVLSWWHGTDVSYLKDKIVDLNGGRADCSTVWNEEEADKALAKLMEELQKDVRQEVCAEFEEALEADPTIVYDDWLKKYIDQPFVGTRKKFGEKVTELCEWRDYEPELHLSDQHEWHEFLNRHGSDIWGDCYHEIGLYEFGMITNPMISIHKEAFDLAITQLIDKKTQFCLPAPQ